MDVDLLYNLIKEIGSQPRKNVEKNFLFWYYGVENQKILFQKISEMREKGEK